MKKILLVEDNAALRELIADFLEGEEFTVETKEDGQAAWEALETHSYDLILLDVMMPKMDGFTLCRRIREREDVPILFLTARVQEEDQLRGYHLGADDYITKPFSLPVLKAKCQAILSRKGGEGWISAGGLRLSPARHMVLCGGQKVLLPALEFSLLQYFMSNPGRVLTREQILLKLKGYEYEGSDRMVDTHVKKLRRALGTYGQYIRTVVKAGYVFDAESGEML